MLQELLSMRLSLLSQMSRSVITSEKEKGRRRKRRKRKKRRKRRRKRI